MIRDTRRDILARALIEQQSAAASDVDLMSDQELLAIAGPGFQEFEQWALHGTMPTTIDGLDLVGKVLLASEPLWPEMAALFPPVRF